MATIKNREFVELSYTAKTKEGMVFDTTDEKLAEQNSLEGVKGPVVICVGEQQVLPGLDKQIDGKEVGTEYTIELQPQDAFGKKDAKLIQLVQTSKFTKQGIQPMPGMPVTIDDMMATIKSVSGGRTLVDFNHPMAGKDVSYQFKINKIVTDDAEKLKAYLAVSLGLKEVPVELKEGIASVSIKEDMPKEIGEMLSKKVCALIPNIKTVTFVKQ